MINQIQNAFVRNEVSFPIETFVNYLKNLAAKKPSLVMSAEGTVIRYHHGFNNISVLQKGGPHKL